MAILRRVTSKNMGYITKEQYDDLMVKLCTIQKQLIGLTKTIRAK